MQFVRWLFRNRLTRWVAGLFLLAGLPARAQRLPFFNLGIEEGLIQSQATTLTQDRRGNLWIGTLGGLTRYDGRTLTGYSVRDGLPANSVLDVLAHADGSLYVATSKGLVVFDGRRFRNLTADPATQLQQTTDGAVWCLSHGACCRVTDTGLVPLSGGVGFTAFYMAPDRSALWVAGAGSVRRVQQAPRVRNQAWALPRTGGKPAVVRRLARDRRGRTWALTNGGPLLEAGDRFAPPDIPRTDAGWPPVYAAAEAGDGSLWFATARGVLRLTDSTAQRYGQTEGLSDNPFFDAFRDAEGNIWLASDGQGVFRFSGAPFTALDASTGLKSQQVMAVAAGRQGWLYLGTYDAGLFVQQDGHIAPVRLLPGTQPAVTALAFGPEGELWVGTRGAGLFQQRGNRFVHHTTATPGVRSDDVTALRTDDQGRLWIGFVNGASVWTGTGFRALAVPGTAVYDFLALGNDSLLLAGGDGLLTVASDIVRPLRTGTLADSARVQCLARGGDTLWLGTGDNGVIAYIPAAAKAVAINRERGLRSEFVYNLLVDRTGAVWAGTGRGIHRLHRGPDGALQVDYFGRAQGVPGLESNHNAAWALPDGRLWFGTTGGAALFRPGAAVVRPRPLALLLDEVLVFGQSVPDTTWFRSRDSWTGIPQGLRLPYRQNNLTFSFHAVSLAGTDSLYYRYRIAGLDAPWSAWTPTRTVTFSALPPGRLVFQVQVSTDRKTALHSLLYPFTIATPFYRTGWFRLLLVGACIGLGGAVQYAASRRRRRREAWVEALRLEEQAKVRQRTAEDFHDEVGNTLTRINVLTNVLQAQAGAALPQALPLIRQIQENTGRLYGGTRDILWSLQPCNDNLYEILHRIRDTGTALFEGSGTAFVFTGTTEAWRRYRLPLDASRNLTMIFKEAFNNILKYAQAMTATLEVHTDGNALQLRLTDDGTGFDPDTVTHGHGLSNMQKRAARLGGQLKLDAALGRGTVLVLRVAAQLLPGPPPAHGTA